jgi:hypothetical protein
MEEFHGKGYSNTPLTNDESAQFRHMYATVSQDWGALKKLIIVIKAVVILYDAIKYVGPVLIVLAGIGYYLKTQGVI